MYPYRADKRKAEEMSSYSATSDQRKSQMWRNELAMDPTEPMPLNAQAFFKEFQQKYGGIQAQQGQPGSHGQQGRPILAGYHGQHGQNGRISQPVQPGQHGQTGTQGSYGQPGLRSQPVQPGQPGQPSQLGQPGPQVLAGATVCCDQANCGQTKIEQIFPEQYMHEPDYIYVSATPFTLLPPSDGPQAGMKDGSPGAGEQFNMQCPCGLNRGQLVTICCTGRYCDESTKIDDIQMGPPEEKRAKTTYNQYKY